MGGNVTQETKQRREALYPFWQQNISASETARKTGISRTAVRRAFAYFTTHAREATQLDDKLEQTGQS